MKLHSKKTHQSFKILKFSLLSLGLFLGTQHAMADDTCSGTDTCGSACDSINGSYWESCINCTVDDDKLTCYCADGASGGCNNGSSDKCCSKIDSKYMKTTSVYFKGDNANSLCKKSGGPTITNTDGELGCVTPPY